MTGKHSKICSPLWVLLLSTAMISGCAGKTASTAPEPLYPLIEAMNQRLDIATDVAQSKFYSGKPVQDSEREQQVIANAETQATSYSLDKAQVRQFMTAQIEANKMVQYARIEHWHATQPPEKPVDSLTAGIRVRLDELQPLMMQKYAAFQPYRSDANCPNWVSAGIQRQTSDPIVVTALQRATAELCAAKVSH